MYAAFRRKPVVVVVPVDMVAWVGVDLPRLPDDALVEYRRLDGQTSVGRVGMIGWSRRGESNDVVAYRVLH